jgi:NADPH2:quinone reductase
MARIARIERTGGPEVIQLVDEALPLPGPGEVRLRSTAIGVNFIDTYFRSGLYPVPLPSGIGSEGAGVIEALGAEVEAFAVGDRVATFGPKLGAYATERNLPAASLFKLPDGVSDETAAAVLLKGCTAEFLAERCGRVQPGWTVLVHASAGGVGQILVRWLKAIGATVIGTAGTGAKAEAARAAGADHVIVHRGADIAAWVRELTGGAGVPVVFDGVGGATWEASLASTARRGLIVSYGNAGGPVEGVKLASLARNGSLFVSRPTLYDYYATPEDRAAGIARLFAMLESGAVRAEIGQRYRLEEAADVHRALEAGETVGATILMP